MLTKNGVLMIMLSLLVLGAFSCRVCKADGSLVGNFYSSSCPQAELIVRNITRNKVQSNSALAAKLLRMHFHDCFVRGCDASVLLDAVGGIKAEKDAVPNQSLSGFEVIDEIKTKLEQVCPGIVSCADILALAARDAVTFPLIKPKWEILTGRRDGNVSLASEVSGNIPTPFSDFTTLNQIFINKGLDLNDLVVLSGAHTIGVAHCVTFSNRLYNFTGQGDSDPSLDKDYAKFLRTQCPNPADPKITVAMDPKSSLSFDNNYFSVLLQNKGLFQSDAALLKNGDSAKIVRQMMISNAFPTKFAKSMEKLGATQVLTGNAGQIRKNCRVIN